MKKIRKAQVTDEQIEEWLKNIPSPIAAWVGAVILFGFFVGVSSGLNYSTPLTGLMLLLMILFYPTLVNNPETLQKTNIGLFAMALSMIVLFPPLHVPWAAVVAMFVLAPLFALRADDLGRPYWLRLTQFTPGLSFAYPVFHFCWRVYPRVRAY